MVAKVWLGMCAWLAIWALDGSPAAAADPTLQVKDIADLFVTATERIEWYWNFYVVSLLALIGWLVSKEKALTRHLKVTVTAGYIVFALMNVYGLWGSYAFAEALRADLVDAAKSVKQLEQTQAVLAKHSMRLGPWIAVAIHLVLGGLVVWVVWTDWLRSPATGKAGSSEDRAD